MTDDGDSGEVCSTAPGSQAGQNNEVTHSACGRATPASGCVVSKRWNLLTWAVVCVAIAGAAGVKAAQSTGSLPPRLAMLFVKDYVASPFFTLEAFGKVERGMTEDQVRQLIGYPLERGGFDVKSCIWTYTVPPDRPKGWYRHCTVAFDEKTHRAIRVRDHFGAYSTGYLRAWVDKVHWKVGEIRLFRSNGDELRLTPSTPKPYIIVFDPGLRLLPMPGLPAGLTDRLQAGLDYEGIEEVDIVVLRVPDVVELRTGFSAEPAPLPSGAYQASEPALGSVAVPMCVVYWRGTVYALPGVNLTDPPEAWAGDFTYLMASLGCSGK